MSKTKGYIVTDKDGWCGKFRYEIGKKYLMNGSIVGEQGYEYYGSLDDLIHVSTFNDGERIFEIEVLGETMEGIFYYITDILVVRREIHPSEFYYSLTTKVPHGHKNIVPRKHFNFKFDNDGYLIYDEDSLGSKYHYKYNKKGQLVRKIEVREDKTIKWYYKYDKHGNKCKVKNNKGDKFVSKFKYDRRGKILYYKDWYDNEYWYEPTTSIDEEVIKHFKSWSGDEIFYENTFNEDNKLIYQRNSYYFKHEKPLGELSVYEYDDNGNKVYEKEGDMEYWYGDDGNCIKMFDNKYYYESTYEITSKI